MEFSYSQQDSFHKGLRSRVFWITTCIFIAFFVIVIRLWYLQIVESGKLKAQSESNRIREVPFPDYRGNIYDRNGIELVTSRPSFDLVIVREDISDIDSTLDKLLKVVTFDKQKVKKEINSLPPFVPYKLVHDIDRDVTALIEENRYELPGVSIAIQPIRVYRYSSFASHLVGYLGEISGPQLKERMFRNYRQGEVVGQYGIEKTFEPLLRGRKGRKIIEVDATGRELQTLRVIESGMGKDINLSIDYETQAVAEKLMKNYRGSVVAMIPQTGEIIAMVSSPPIDLNKFAYGVEREYWKELLDNKYKPLNNRAIQGVYAPASTYKIIVTAAALEEGVIDEKTTFFCPGYLKLGRKVYKCWHKSGHGKIDLNQAITQSCDVYFYNVGLKLGVDNIAKWAEKFGLNKVTGVGLQYEKRGLIPTTAWKEKNKNEVWVKGETLSVAIGQGFTLVTPIQMVGVIGSIANGGYIVSPKLLSKAGDGDDGISRIPVGLSDRTLEILKKGLLNVVEGPGGTGGRARIWGIQVAGKTGTAQIFNRKEGDRRPNSALPEKLRDNAWFVSYAPADNPKIAVAVVIEHVGHGGTYAAPIAREVMKVYLNGLKKKEQRAKNDG